MRTIKFRAWADGKMDYSPETFIGWLNDNFEFDGYDEGKEPKVMQFTGLLDRHGKEIYEGDITSSEWQIKFDEGMFVPFYDFGRQERYEDVGTDWWSSCEIIGNIYENPDLLK